MPYRWMATWPVAICLATLAACDAVDVHALPGAAAVAPGITAVGPHAIDARSDTQQVRGCLHCAP